VLFVTCEFDTLLVGKNNAQMHCFLLADDVTIMIMMKKVSTYVQN